MIPFPRSRPFLLTWGFLFIAKSAAAQSPATRELLDLTLEPVQILTAPGPEYGDDVRSMNMILGIDRAPAGRLWAAWISGGDSELGYLVAASSDDGGATWSPPRLVIDPANHPGGMARRVLVGNVWTDPRGRVWLFFDVAMGYFDGRAGVWAIRCDNPDADQPEWSLPRRIWHGATLNKPLVLQNGDWLLPVSLWRRERIKGSTEHRRPTIPSESVPADFAEAFAELDEVRKAHVLVSKDQGETWTRSGAVEFPHFNFDEHMMVELGDGRLWMLARTLEGIHESFSSDKGATWTAPQPRFPHINARFFLRRLASGRLLLVRHGEMDERTRSRSHLRAFLSEDDGASWQGGLLLDERSGISYPDGFESPSGLIHILYDHRRYDDAEILLATFTEDDILSGEFQSPQARQRILVNKARGAPPKRPVSPAPSP